MVGPSFHRWCPSCETITLSVHKTRPYTVGSVTVDNILQSVCLRCDVTTEISEESAHHFSEEYKKMEE